MGWKKLSGHEIFTHPRLSLVEDKIELPDGSTSDYLMYTGLRDYVTVIVKKGELYLAITEYAYPVDKDIYQFPEGEIENDETPEAAAKREAYEETGITITNAQVVGSSLHHHRRSSVHNPVVLADFVSEETGMTRAIEEQSITAHWLSEKDIWNKIADGEIIQKNFLSAWSVLQAKLKLEA